MSAPDRIPISMLDVLTMLALTEAYKAVAARSSWACTIYLMVCRVGIDN
jgi:hypothetical protein